MGFRVVRSIAVCALLSATAISSLRVYPHHLAYFNEYVGGPENGHRHLLHSNLDWGQDLCYLDVWLKGQGLAWKDVGLYECGRDGIGSQLFESQSFSKSPIRPKYIAISANRLVEWDRMLPRESELVYVTKVGYTLWLFRYRESP